MPCILAVLALATPRLVVALLYLFSHWFEGLFTSALWPVLGFFFLPTTQHWFAGQWTVGPNIGLVLALMVDVSPASGRRRPRSE